MYMTVTLLSENEKEYFNFQNPRSNASLRFGSTNNVFYSMILSFHLMIHRFVILKALSHTTRGRLTMICMFVIIEAVQNL